MRRRLLHCLGRASGLVALLSIACWAGPSAEGDGSSGDTGPAESGGTGLATSGAVDETGAGSCDDPESAVTAIFMESCAATGCHGPMAAASLDLVSDGWQMRLIGQPSSLCEGWIRVVPGDPDGSMLMNKLGPMPACGQTMPVGGRLPAEDVACIGEWIVGLPPVECETCGGQACVDLQTDSDHCGVCNDACPPGVQCVEGICACPDDTMACGGTCVDPLANGQHCGECNNPCEGGTVCLAGACVDGCGALTECDGGCVNTDTDPLHCGGCDAPCGPGASCTGGSCECPGDPVSYTADIEPQIVADCTGMGCHGFPAPQEGLDLRAGMGYGSLVGQPSSQCPGEILVEPGQVGASYLVNKLTGVDMCFGTMMPKGLGTWTPAQVERVSAWICQGAPM